MREQIREFFTEWLRASEVEAERGISTEIIQGLWEQFSYEREEEIAEWQEEFTATVVDMWAAYIWDVS